MCYGHSFSGLERCTTERRCEDEQSATSFNVCVVVEDEHKRGGGDGSLVGF